MKTIRELDLKDARITGGFWKNRVASVARDVIPYQWKALNNEIPDVPASHAVENFRIAAGEATGSPMGTIFQDSDVAKWIEAASYSLLERRDADLEKKIDELVRLIGKSQRSDGYVNTFFIAAGDEKRWTDLVMGHELYCAGHMIEAAVAYFGVTGKRALLDVMTLYADYIGEVFGDGPGQNRSFDGHPEIELALHRLALATGNAKYARLASHFVDARGHVRDFYKGRAAKEGMIPDSRWFRSDYYLADRPVREMRAVEGHSVRAMYLYCAMADQYRAAGDETLKSALDALWKNAVTRHMYVTAALGSQSHGERFTIDWDLPNDTCYAETCASIGLALWSWRMSLIEPKGEYADVFERAMYNGILSGISLDGTGYLYVNPLEVVPDVASFRQDQSHVAVSRVGWFDCACCPTNVARFIASIGGHIASVAHDGVWVHQYASCKLSLQVGDGAGSGVSGDRVAVLLSQETDYPWTGDVAIRVDPETPAEFALRVRIPSWCDSFAILVNGVPVQDPAVKNGYAALSRAWKPGDIVKLEMDMPVRLLGANVRVRENAGKVAIQRGPIVYCVEEFDNGADLHALVLDAKREATVRPDGSIVPGSVSLELAGYRETSPDGDDALYAEYGNGPKREPCVIRAIPYYQWGNRKKKQEMLVWLRLANGQ
jgi:uncharacterized protein